MEQNILLTKISSQIETLKLQIESISSQPDLIYRIDIESLKRNVSLLYDLLYLLKPVGTIYQENNDEPPLPSEIQSSVAKGTTSSTIENTLQMTEKPIVEAKEQYSIISEEKEPAMFGKPVEHNDFEEDVSIGEDVFDNQHISIDLDVEAPVTETITGHFQHLAFGSTLDLFETQVPASIGEKLVTNHDVSVAGHMQQKKIDDLRAAIGINEKFLFINELFGGNLHQYNNTIEELNNFRSLSGARTYLNELSVQHQWPPHSEALAKLNQLIERKF
jgi:hypothetical protein